MFKYIYDGKRHTDTTQEYMIKIGMSTEAIESVHRQKNYEEAQQKQLKADAYLRESDPLYIEWQKELARNNPEADQYKQCWLDKVEEIEKRHPTTSNS